MSIELPGGPDGKLLALGGRDKTIKLWDVKTGKETATLKGSRHRLAMLDRRVRFPPGALCAL